MRNKTDVVMTCALCYPLVMIIIIVIIHERFQELAAELARSGDLYKNVNDLLIHFGKHDLASYTG